MGARRYILQSLWHYRFAYLGVFLGSVLGAMVLLGALFAGSSVDESLKQIGQNRIGKTTYLITGGDRFFTEDLAKQLSDTSETETAPVLFAKGVGSASGASVNNVQLVGVTDAFWTFAPKLTSIELDGDEAEVAVNQLLAERLSLKIGDTLILRFQKPGVVAGNAPVAGADNELESFRSTVKVIVDDASFGRFGLETTQVPQSSVFVPIQMLQRAFDFPGRANLVLIHSDLNGEAIQTALNKAMKLADYQLSLDWLELAQVWEIKSDRVFIDSDIGHTLSSQLNEVHAVTSYLVNNTQLGELSTPYSIGTAVSPVDFKFLPRDLRPTEVVLNSWIAEDLSASPGDEVELTYFQTGRSGLLVEQSSSFTVRSIVSMEGLAGDRSWMPNFPGISDAEVPSDWDAGLPLDLDRIRTKDDEYWEEHRGTPKLFLSLETGENIWATQWGNYTAIRVPVDRSRREVLKTQILGLLNPEMNQLLVQDFKSRAEASVSSAVDFGGLFVGMSFFLILASLGLVAMLFQFCLLQRNRESALLGSIGVKGRSLLKWRLSEAVVILLTGSLFGLILATWYTRQILNFLEKIWANQTTTSTFVFHADSTTILIGILTFLILSLLFLWLSIRKQARRSLSIRLKANTEEFDVLGTRSKKPWFVAILGGIVGIFSVIISGSLMPAQGAFYLAGFAFLIAGLAVFGIWLRREPNTIRHRELNTKYIGRLNIAFRASRSLTLVGLIASAVFMVLSVASFRKQVGSDWLERSSGTGGFALMLETTSALNLPRDGATEGFEIFASSRDHITQVVPFRKGTGDNVNCFNLNTSAQPQLVGVDTTALQKLDAFAPRKLAADVEGEGWSKLRGLTPVEAIPAFVDETTLTWALKRKVGDIFTYEDEKGESFDVQIVGSIKDSLFQGYLIIDEGFLLKEFPTHEGYSMFLVNALPGEDLEALRRKIETQATDVGGTVELTRDILKSFHEIENTYIAIFNVLGSLGVVLGSLGLTIVVSRGIQERMGEFSVMSAIGIARNLLGRLIFIEFGQLVFWGLGIGLLASVISIMPNLQSLPALPTIILVLGLLLGIVVLNLICGVLTFNHTFPKEGVSLKQVER